MSYNAYFLKQHLMLLFLTKHKSKHIWNSWIVFCEPWVKANWVFLALNFSKASKIRVSPQNPRWPSTAVKSILMNFSSNIKTSLDWQKQCNTSTQWDKSLLVDYHVKKSTYQSRPRERLSRFIWVRPLSPNQSVFYKEQLEDIMYTNPLTTSPIDIIKFYQNLKFNKTNVTKLQGQSFLSKQSYNLKVKVTAIYNNNIFY